jgi:hypothetical protein
VFKRICKKRPLDVRRDKIPINKKYENIKIMIFKAREYELPVFEKKNPITKIAGSIPTIVVAR